MLCLISKSSEKQNEDFLLWNKIDLNNYQFNNLLISTIFWKFKIFFLNVYFFSILILSIAYFFPISFFNLKKSWEKKIQEINNMPLYSLIVYILNFNLKPSLPILLCVCIFGLNVNMRFQCIFLSKFFKAINHEKYFFVKRLK